MVLDYTWIVDDDAIFTFTVKKILKLNNLTNRIDVFVNGLDAKEQIEKCLANKEGLPNVILLDINMPMLDGWQFMDYFSQLADKKNIAIYLVSSSIDPRDREKAKLYKDIQDFIVKPVTLSALKDLMNDAKSLVKIS